MNKTILQSVTNRAFFVVFVALSTTTTPSAEAEPSPTPKSAVFVNLQSKANQKLTDSMHGLRGNDLAELPKGEQTFAGVRFKVEDSYLRLSGTIEMGGAPKKPAALEGIPIDKSFTRLHILHGTHYGAFGKAGETLFVKDGTPIGEYRLRYEDGTTKSIPIVYGEDVRDWWVWDKPAEVTRGKIAWVGKNAFSKEQNQTIRLYFTSWNNPHPEKKVSSFDYVCNGTSAAAPFCVAISLEQNSQGN
jgi:hypothetical protein